MLIKTKAAGLMFALLVPAETPKSVTVAYPCLNDVCMVPKADLNAIMKINADLAAAVQKCTRKGQET